MHRALGPLRGRWLPILTACLVLPSLPVASTGNVFGSEEVILAIIDSGVRPTHQEFDWSGDPADPTDQFVAWWDFSDGAGPRHRPLPGQRWDPLVSTPYDDRGHGTAVASLAAGLNHDPENLKTRSYCPGCRIALAKVLNAAGTGDPADVAAAIRWAVDDVHADVLNLALTSGLPQPGAATSFDEAIEYARDRGVLVVAAAGNGPAEINQPGQPSWAHGPGFSTAALVVGGGTYSGSSTGGTRFGHDPEVTAYGDGVIAATNTGDGAYASDTGSSLSTALVAGMATRLLLTGLANACASSAGYLEALLKFVAKDTIAPYTLEGFGFLSKDQFASANATFAPACVLPTRPTLDLTRLYDEAAAQTFRTAVSRGLDAEGGSNWALTDQPDPSGPRVLGPGAPIGVQELELWSLQARFGERVTVGASFSTDPAAVGTLNDFEIYLFRPGSDADGLLQGTELAAFSREFGRAPESFTIQFADAGDYLLAVVGFSIVVTEAYDLSISSTMSDPSLVLDRSIIAVGEHGII